MSVPRHIAIIPDGNRRWAKARRLNLWEGHREGVRRFWEVGQEAFNEKVEYITFWAASYDNLKKRSKLEVKFLINIIADELLSDNFLENCIRNKSRFLIIGEWKEFIKNQKLIAKINSIEDQTKHFEKRFLTILFGYDGKREMLAAMNALPSKNINELNFLKQLWTGGLPDVDLVIRTGGEPHWSAGFMMWLIANSQFYFSEMLWPDFKKQELKKALVDYERRERRLGK